MNIRTSKNKKFILKTNFHCITHFDLRSALPFFALQYLILNHYFRNKIVLKSKSDQRANLMIGKKKDRSVKMNIFLKVSFQACSICNFSYITYLQIKINILIQMTNLNRSEIQTELYFFHFVLFIHSFMSFYASLLVTRQTSLSVNNETFFVNILTF